MKTIKKKPWSGRFGKQTQPLVESFTESVSFDWRLYKHDIQGSIAHSTMLAACGLISGKERDSIIKALHGIQKDIESDHFEFSTGLEDVHMNIEAALIERIGDTGKKLHTARSRNDQVALDMRLWCREQTRHITGLIEGLQRALVSKADEYHGTVIPGFTHLQHAQPVLLSHYLLAYVEMLERDRERLADCLDRVNVSPLGACALAGTTLPIDPAMTARLLGFKFFSNNSVDATSDRDFCIEFASCLAILAMHISRLAEEWIIWSTEEFGFLELDESLCTGSSIMPQKKNPDALELLRAKCARVYGNLLSLFTLMKALPLSYNRDMQEDKVAVFDTASTVSTSLELLCLIVKGVDFRVDNIKTACEKGFLDATALAEYLVRKGLPFREAHEVVGKTVRAAVKRKKRLAELSIDELRKFSGLIDNDVYRILGVENCVKHYAGPGSTAPREVKKRLAFWKKKLKLRGKPA
ncbi:MAG: argininosuccinate lyase [Candidatus Brocadiales bacterium]|nr:argininosuccinate lyase [Candidatus Bathyanammoxibius amoris]